MRYALHCMNLLHVKYIRCLHPDHIGITCYKKFLSGLENLVNIPYIR